MCGRFFLSVPGPDLACHFELAEPPPVVGRFNVVPGQTVPLVRVVPDAGSGSSRELRSPIWGFVPSWAKDPRGGRRPINARAETVATSPMFRQAFARRRGLVPASGFYEWQHAGRSARPFAIRPREGGLLAFAAIFEQRERDDSVLESCAILTTDAAEPVRAIHDRMPVCVPVDAHAHWLDPEVRDASALAPLLRAGAETPLDAYPIDRRVNDVREDDPRLLEPVRDLFSTGGPP